MQVTDLQSSRQSFKPWKAKQITPCTRYFSRALRELQVIAENCDWLIALFAPVVIGWSNYFCFGFSTVIWKTFLKKQITKLLSLQIKAITKFSTSRCHQLSEPEKQTSSEIPEFLAYYFIQILTQLIIRFVGFTESSVRAIMLLTQLKSVSPLRSMQGIQDSGINNSLA